MAAAAVVVGSEREITRDSFMATSLKAQRIYVTHNYHQPIDLMHVLNN